MATNDNDNNGGAWTVVRVLQVLTLIPCWALLAAVISNYNSHGQITPSSIQFLFAIALILSVWSFCLIVTFARARNTALWMTFFDILGMALLIAAVVWLSNIANVECLAVYTVNWTSYQNTTVLGGPYTYDPSTKIWSGSRLLRRLAMDQATNIAPLGKRTYVDASGHVVDPPLYYSQCGLIKGAWGLAITNIILFFISAILSAVIYQSYNQRRKRVVREKVVVGSPVRPVVGVAQPPPVYRADESAYGGSTYGGSRRYSTRSSVGSRSGRRQHHYRRGSRAGSDYYV